MRFFVYSLPRSGSAWLSVFLTGRNSYCFHDPLVECGNPGDLRSLLKSRNELFVGCVDTAGTMFRQYVESELGVYRILSLIRDPEDCIKSLRNIGFAGCLPEFKPFGRFIEYRYLSNVDYLEDLWGWLFCTDFDKDRAERLIEMRIQRDANSVLSKYDQNKANRLRMAC